MDCHRPVKLPRGEETIVESGRVGASESHERVNGRWEEFLDRSGSESGGDGKLRGENGSWGFLPDERAAVCLMHHRWSG